MPKIALVFLAVICAGIGVSACHSNSSTGITPPPVPTPSLTPDPLIKVAIIQVTIAGTPTVNIPIAMSTPASVAHPRPGKTITTLESGADGVARFENLSYKHTYCWVATLSPSKTASVCAPPTVWQFTDPIVLGT
ncbi:MAG: hypothetical protein JO199_11310 [Candidatus Eremiobacteraeota bacterium]|nr:hypothetical protein [Candidatus Eremiobacteraeota bacterium]